ncbi:hypothetical protein NLU13_1842 [Sarocladium strictum]|uniref:LPXTG-domain-containing protein n=1 Tax=Sarocladium strictum TaxID=5046 RepID=A0AA39GRR2_SARSR|nr:hypothetical protein NLU13_1842 [Sarocladium strictum]
MAFCWVASWLWLTILTTSHGTRALQVTPGSPCAEFCVDDKALDPSDPTSSNNNNNNTNTTTSKDIVCNDFDFSSGKTGKTFQRCMTCLQGSDFARGSESDLDWFLYNLRYSFDYCVFGDMHASHVDSSPCTTSEGCGRLTKALRDDMVNAADTSPYAYCDADHQAIHGEGFDKCHSCVAAEDTHSYISNFLVALAIACDQRPAPGHLLGLNETVFTKNTIQAINPSDLTSKNHKDSPSPLLLLPTTAIVGISVGGLVLVLLGLGCGYVQYRKRRNRHRASGWSFRCQARSGSLPSRNMNRGHDEEEEEEEAAKRARFHEIMAERMWTSPSESRVTGLFPAPPASTMSGSKASAREGIASIVTRPPPRPAVLTSGRNFASPVLDDHATTPSSATSARSTRPLLRNDSPASYSARSFSNGSSSSNNNYAHAVGASRVGASPMTAQSDSAAGWEEQQRITVGPRTLTASPVTTRQVEVRNFSTTFPPPPGKG